MSAYEVPGTRVGPCHELSHLTLSDNTAVLSVHHIGNGEGAAVVKSAVSGCPASNPGAATYCVTPGKLLKLSVLSSSAK